MIFPKKPEILYAPMLATFGGGSANGFRSSGGGPSDPYPFVFTTNATVKYNQSSFHNVSQSSISGYNGYEYPNLAPTITGDANGYIDTVGANQNGTLKYGRMQLTSAECDILGIQIVHVRGCRGGNFNNQYANSNPGLVNGGKGSALEVEMNFPAMYSAYKWGGQLHLYFMGGLRGPDLTSSAGSMNFPATGGGGASVLAIYDGSNLYPMVVAAGGGGAFHTTDTPNQRPGLDAFLPSSNLTTYQVYTQYDPDVSAYRHNSSYITPTARPWQVENASTGSGSGSSWLHKSITYASQQSYHGEIPPLRDFMMSIFGTVSPVWNVNNPTGNDAHWNGVIYGGFGGGGSGAYGAGGGAGYFGGWSGDYNQQNAYPNYGRARGGQSFYDSTYCTLVSHTLRSNANTGQFFINA